MCHCHLASLVCDIINVNNILQSHVDKSPQSPLHSNMPQGLRKITKRMGVPQLLMVSQWIFWREFLLFEGITPNWNSIVNNNAQFGNKSRYTQYIYIYIYSKRLQMSPNCNHCNPHVFHGNFFDSMIQHPEKKKNMGEHLHHEHSSKKVLILARDPSSNCSSKTFSKEYSCLVYLGTMKKLMLQKGFHGLEPSCRTWHASNQFSKYICFLYTLHFPSPFKKEHNMFFHRFVWFQKSLDLTSI